MGETPKIVLPHGGYRNLVAYQKSDVIYQGTVREEDFKKHGGVKERMHDARTAARGEEWDKTVYSRLDSATDVAELTARADEIRRGIERAVRSIKQRKGWQ